ncbi:hypothetical protein BN1095_2410001 [Clostridioides difficile]|uniref:Uncharacterized protein n=1 Tax=Clostridioides difficile TaxID=1496 RepID=A0A069AL20_CLODI|nr:hypothetical protein BN1095_2410001 [Clostridioides difficile]
MLQHFQHGGMAGLVEVADAVVAAIDGQDVLNQVVGTDGDEIDQFQNTADGQRGRRNFNHTADADFTEGIAAFGKLALRGVEVDEALAHFGY